MQIKLQLTNQRNFFLMLNDMITEQEVIKLINDQDVCKLKAYLQTLSYLPELLCDEEKDSRALIASYFHERYEAINYVKERAEEMESGLNTLKFDRFSFTIEAIVDVSHFTSKGNYMIPTYHSSHVSIVELRITLAS